MVDVAEIEKRIDVVKAGGVAISNDVGGIKFTSMAEVMEFAKLMSVSGVAVPHHLRGNPGACLAIAIQALEWRMSPFAVANKSYMANDRIAYESQLIHALVEARAPLKGRLRYKITGEGDERRCTVWGTFRNELSPHEYESETLAKLRDARGRNDRGQVKGSPLWENQPETQLFYSASRTWARMFCPDVILGIYAVDELPDTAVDVPLSKVDEYTKKLRDAKLSRVAPARGFDADRVRRTIIEGEANKETKNETAKGSDSESVLASGRANVDGREGGDTDANRRAASGDSDPVGGPQPAGHDAEGEQAQGDIFPPDGEAEKPKGKRK
jgi:hypothetical protein